MIGDHSDECKSKVRLNSQSGNHSDASGSESDVMNDVPPSLQEHALKSHGHARADFSRVLALPPHP
jgi:hypothetical protein